MIEDDEVRRSGSHRAFELLQLPLPIRWPDRASGALQDFAGNAGSGAGDEVSQLGHGFFRRELTALVVQGGRVAADATSRAMRAARGTFPAAFVVSEKTRIPSL